MTEHKIHEKIRQAYIHATPDVLNAVLSDCRKEKGCAIMTITTKKRKSLVTQLAGIAACLCLLLGGGLGLHNYQINRVVDATVSLDVNPSVEIQVNQKERVLKVLPLNEDGRIIVGNMDFTGSDVNVAVNAMIGSMLQNGYLSELTNSILISVDNKNIAKGVELQERLTAEVNELLQTDTFHGAILSQTVSKNEELQQLSDTYGITLGKAQLIQDVLTEDSRHTFEELAPLSINELNLLLQKESTGNTKVETLGTASDKAYIGETKAKEIALQKAGVAADSLISYKIELDTEWGNMVYDVEFTAEGIEYDCELNAKTGEVLKFEKENKFGGNQTVNVAPVQEATPTPEPTTAPTTELPPSTSNAPSTAATPSNGNQAAASQTASQITLEQAKAIALSHAGVDAGTVYDFDGEWDYEHGIAVYELDFKSGGYEYDYEVNAVTGEILKSEKEWDD